ncbi:hypothetical protein BDZ85DRAFT_284179 [Elsinoe ampelina]|uniref:BRCT domain-containing protein n=1 Tax=Elsinoe ampelina TaxID=302913 RepID=A0A6A6G4S9_9PEZI|nr:hypothetical protein BDZ85DRAFT_284179 [Elsinoe ampelina]
MRGGTVQHSLQPTTTHLIIAKSEWEKKGKQKAKIIQEAVKRPSIRMVTADYMDHYFRNSRPLGGKTVPAEHDYRKSGAGKSFTSAVTKEQAREAKRLQNEADKEEKRRQKEKMKLEKQLAKAEAKANKRPRSALIAELADHTAQYAGPKAPLKQTKPRNKKGLMAEEVRKHEAAKRAARHVSLDGYNIFIDHTGFSYEINLIKVQIEFNLNQTLLLKFYESTADAPKSYAVTKMLCGSLVDEEKSEMIAGPGVAFPVAFRAFKNAFKEATAVDWNDRMTFPRTRKDPTAVSETPNRAFASVRTQVTPKGIWKAIGSKTIDDEKAAAFLNEKFRWRAPHESQPIGVMGPMNALGEAVMPEGLPPAHAVSGHQTLDAVAGVGAELGMTSTQDPVSAWAASIASYSGLAKPIEPNIDTTHSPIAPSSATEGATELPTTLGRRKRAREVVEDYDSDAGYDADADGLSDDDHGEASDDVQSPRKKTRMEDNAMDVDTVMSESGETEVREADYMTVKDDEVVRRDSMDVEAGGSPPHAETNEALFVSGAEDNEAEESATAAPVDTEAATTTETGEPAANDEHEGESGNAPQKVQGGPLFSKQCLAIRMLTSPQQPTIPELMGRPPITSFEKHLHQLALAQKALKQKMRK